MAKKMTTQQITDRIYESLHNHAKYIIKNGKDTGVRSLVDSTAFMNDMIDLYNQLREEL